MFLWRFIRDKVTQSVTFTTPSFSAVLKIEVMAGKGRISLIFRPWGIVLKLRV